MRDQIVTTANTAFLLPSRKRRRGHRVFCLCLRLCRIGKVLIFQTIYDGKAVRLERDPCYELINYQCYGIGSEGGVREGSRASEGIRNHQLPKDKLVGVQRS